MRSENKEAEKIIKQLEERNKEIEYNKLPTTDGILNSLG